MKNLIILAILLVSKITYAGFTVQGVSSPQNQSVDLATSSFKMALTFKNTGSAIDSITPISGTNASEFDISPNRCVSIAATKTCALTIVSKRSITTGTKSISLSGLDINISITNSTTQNSGTESINFTPFTIPDFTFSGVSTQSITFVLTNDGQKDVQLQSLSFSQASTNLTLPVDRCSNSTLKKGSTCSIQIKATKPLGVVNTTLIAKTSNNTQASLSVNLIGEQSCVVGGTTFKSGATVNGYTQSLVPYGQTCAPLAVSGVCQNGSVSNGVVSTTCQVSAPVNCTLDGKTILHGKSVNGFTQATVPFGESCSTKSASGFCSNGTISNGIVSSSCSALPNTATSCQFNGQTIASGSAVNAYQSLTVPFGQTCQIEVRGCTNGSLSGSAQFSSCTVLPAASCSFNGQTYSNGDSVPGFSVSSVPFGSQCSSVAVSGICQNGSISNQPASATCSVQSAASCDFNGSPIVSGSSVIAYLTSSVAFGNTCSSETRTCTNGTLSGSNSFSSCSVNQALDCSFNSQSYPHGSSVPGFSVSSVPFGSQCSSVAVSGTCQNGSITNQPASATCSVDSALSCNYNSYSVNHDSSVVGYSSTYSLTSCSSIETSGSCQNGSVSNTPASSYCAELTTPVDPNLIACDGTTSLNYSINQCFESKGSSTGLANTSVCSGVSLPQPLSFQSPAGTRVISAGLPTGFSSQTYTCTLGQPLAQGTLTDVSCSSGYTKSGLSCIQGPTNTLGLKLFDYESLTSELRNECFAEADFQDGSGVVKLPIRSGIDTDLNNPLSTTQ